jgi:hypothetical protein
MKPLQCTSSRALWFGRYLNMTRQINLPSFIVEYLPTLIITWYKRRGRLMGPVLPGMDALWAEFCQVFAEVRLAKRVP